MQTTVELKLDLPSNITKDEVQTLLKRLLFESYESLKEKLGETHEQTQIAVSKIKDFFPLSERRPSWRQ